MMTEQQPLTTKEAAELLDMTPASVKNICRTGKIACTKVGDGVRAVYYLTMADVEAYKATTHKPGWVKGKPRKVQKKGNTVDITQKNATEAFTAYRFCILAVIHHLHKNHVSHISMYRLNGQIHGQIGIQYAPNYKQMDKLLNMIAEIITTRMIGKQIGPDAEEMTDVTIAEIRTKYMAENNKADSSENEQKFHDWVEEQIYDQMDLPENMHAAEFLVSELLQQWNHQESTPNQSATIPGSEVISLIIYPVQR